MSPKSFADYWLGVILSLLGIAAILGLAISGQLDLYIHPRYFVFSVITASAGVIFVIAAFATAPRKRRDEHEREQEQSSVRGRVGQVASAVGGALLTVTVTVALFVFPPAALNTTLVQSSDLVSVQGPANDLPPLVGGNSSTFTVKDWAGLIRQGAGQDVFQGQTADLIGFVIPDQDDPDNIFYLGRNVITCCAVDAQATGVPVFAPGWQDQLKGGDWVHVIGGFESNPSALNPDPWVLLPRSVVPAEQPEQPYVY